MEIKNAKIESTMLGFEDHGIFTFFLHLKLDHYNQGFGGCGLDEYNKFTKKRVATKLTGQVIMEICTLFGSWESLPGTHVRVKTENNRLIEIGHIIEDRWLNVSELAKELGE